MKQVLLLVLLVAFTSSCDLSDKTYKLTITGARSQVWYSDPGGSYGAFTTDRIFPKGTYLRVSVDPVSGTITKIEVNGKNQYNRAFVVKMDRDVNIVVTTQRCTVPPGSLPGSFCY
jgi:predicted transcriptional regulator